MSEPRVKRTKEKELLERVRSGKCLLCERTDNNRRGLCQKHYQEFLRRRESQPKKERMEFEQLHIREGNILPVNQLRSIRNPSPFAAAE